MNTTESLSTFGIAPRHEQLSSVREILARDAALRDEAREEDLALLCCVQLFSAGLFEDVLLIWSVKSKSQDLGSLIDAQLLCGPGLVQTIEFLKMSTEPAAADALKYIQHCVASGDFEGFNPSGHLAFYRRYFDIPSGP